MPEVLQRTGLSKRTIYRLEGIGRFPARRQAWGPRRGGDGLRVRSWSGWRDTLDLARTFNERDLTFRVPTCCGD